MKLIYSGNSSEGSVEYSIDAGNTFVPVTLADLKKGVELFTNDLANIRVRVGSNVITNISVLKKFKVVETEDDKKVLATLEEKKPSALSVGLYISKASNNFDSSNTYFIFIGDDCIEFTFGDDIIDGFKAFDYSNNSLSYKDYDDMATLLSNNSEYKLYTGNYIVSDSDNSRTFSKFIDTGYTLKISDYIPYKEN